MSPRFACRCLPSSIGKHCQREHDAPLTAAFWLPSALPRHEENAIASTDSTNHARDTNRRARSTGLAVAGAGIVLFNISPFLNWVNIDGDADPRTGYETDSLVPFIAYLGLGLLLAMVYAGKRARRGQHRGLTLVSMAVGLAATIQCLAFALNPMGGLERGDELSAQIGVYVGLIGAAIWALGSGMLAKEIEGDDEHADAHTRDASRTR